MYHCTSWLSSGPSMCSSLSTCSVGAIVTSKAQCFVYDQQTNLGITVKVENGSNKYCDQLHSLYSGPNGRLWAAARQPGGSHFTFTNRDLGIFSAPFWRYRTCTVEDPRLATATTPSRRIFRLCLTFDRQHVSCTHLHRQHRRSFGLSIRKPSHRIEPEGL